jgi:hypothetical protein
MSNCVITRCYGGYTGGAGGCTMYDCTVVGNEASKGYGGVSSCTMYNCVIASNSTIYSKSAGGVRGGTLYNCTVIGNSAGRLGGGAQDATLYNCLVTDNEVYDGANAFGGGTHGCTLYNCTVASNRADNAAGGVYGGVVVNSIVWGNTAGMGEANYAGTPVFTNSCTTPAQGGWAEGNRSTDPLLVGPEDGNFRLLNGSPCIDGGVFFTWMTNSLDARSLDLDGNPRILRSAVDMGTYETPLPPGTLFLVR